MLGLKQEPLTSAQKILNRDYRHSPETLKLLSVVEQCIAALDSLTRGQKSWIFAYQSADRLRAKITHQANILTRIFCKSLSRDTLMRIPAILSCAQMAVLNAYISSTEQGVDRTYLTRLKKDAMDWGELIACVQALNGLCNRPHPFAQGFLSPFDANEFTIQPPRPSVWFIVQSNMKKINEMRVRWTDRIKKAGKLVIKTVFDGLILAHKNTVNLMKNLGKNIKDFYQAKREAYKKSRKIPKPEIITPDGYYVVAVVEDQKISTKSYWALCYNDFKNALKKDIKQGANQLVDTLEQLTKSPPPPVSPFREPGTKIDKSSS